MISLSTVDWQTTLAFNTEDVIDGYTVTRLAATASVPLHTVSAFLFMAAGANLVYASK